MIFDLQGYVRLVYGKQSFPEEIQHEWSWKFRKILKKILSSFPQLHSVGFLMVQVFVGVSLPFIIIILMYNKKNGRKYSPQAPCK